MATAIFLANNLQGARDVDAIGFDAVENFRVRQHAKVTSHPVQDGSDTADHYYQDPVVVSFSGAISPWNFTGKGTDATPLDFIRTVEQTIVNKQPFDLFLSEDLQSIPSCLITKFEYNRAAKEGKSILVDVDVQQVRIVSRAVEVDIENFALAEDVKEQGQDTENGGDSVPKTVGFEDIEAVFRITTTLGGG